MFTTLYFPWDSLKANASLNPTKFFCKYRIVNEYFDCEDKEIGVGLSFETLGFFGFSIALMSPKNKINKSINFLIT